MPVLSNQRHEAVAQAYIADPERVGWRAYQQAYPNASQHGAETGFSRLLKKVEFGARIAELQQGAAQNAALVQVSFPSDRFDGDKPDHRRAFFSYSVTRAISRVRRQCS
jgi:hypothetical protein